MSINLAQLWPELAAGQLPAGTVNALQLDSRQVQAGDVFFALKGAAQASRMAEFVQSALDKGALAVFSECALDGFAGQPVVVVDDLRQWIGLLTQRFLQAQHAVTLATVAAVTGTNGKTTIARLLAELLSLSGHATAVMGTTGNGILPNIEPSTHTTVDAIQLQRQLYAFSQQGAEYLCLEASSHGLDQGRLAGTAIQVALFSNLTRDHLDYHGTLEHYAQAKSRLFAFPSLTHAILNKDDAAWQLMQQVVDSQNQQRQLAAQAPVISWTYSLHDASADFHALHISYSLHGADIQLASPFGELRFHSPLLGHFNVSNVIAAVAGALALGLAPAQVLAGVPRLQGAPGRMQVVADKDRLFVVDYAHTPDALTQVLSSLKPHVEGQGRLWAVFGCGGDRDRGKRPLMTQAALDVADVVLLTADNPRSESVEQILQDMQQGLATPSQVSLLVEPNRRLAIRQVVQQARVQDIVVLAGKGHETYQEIEGIRHWFDDVVELNAALQHVQLIPKGYPV